VHAVLRRVLNSRSNQPSSHQLGVDPELVERAERIDDQERRRRDADQRQGQVQGQMSRREHRLRSATAKL